MWFAFDGINLGSGLRHWPVLDRNNEQHDFIWVRDGVLAWVQASHSQKVSSDCHMIWVANQQDPPLFWNIAIGLYAHDLQPVELKTDIAPGPGRKHASHRTPHATLGLINVAPIDKVRR